MVIEAVEGVYTITDIHNNKTIEITGVVDITPPEAEISVADNTWREFLNTITFGLFYYETQEATITATDVGSGINGVYYYVSDSALNIDEVKELENWTKYTEEIYLEKGNQYVVYAKATDLAGNTTYVSSDGIVISEFSPEDNFAIREPSISTIRCRDSIILHALVSDNFPKGSTIVWTTDNDNFKTEVLNDGKSLKITSWDKGYTTVVATLYDAEGNVLVSDSIEMYSKAGFFSKIGGFFRSIFGSTLHYNY